MWFGMLGPLEARCGERRIDLGAPKQRAVLALLLIEANRVVPVERLVRVLWDDQPPARSSGALQVYVSGLRRALEPERPARMRSSYVVTQAPGYLLRAGPEEVDAFRFEALAAHGRGLLAGGDAAGARQVLADSLSLWRGPALADLAREPFAAREAARLEELRAAAGEDRIEADLALGHHTRVIAELEFLVGEHPLRERLWALLMRALYRSGRQSEALRAYGRARRILAEELGIQPSLALRQLEEGILRQAPELGWPPPDRNLGALAHRPAAASGRRGVSNRGLVGRRDELRRFDHRRERLAAGEGSVVLVSGEPGIGKTRLVEELVARAGDPPALVAWGRCEEGEGTPSFWPWVQIIRSLIAGADPEALGRALAPGAGEIAQIAPEVKDLVAGLEPPAAVEAEVARAHLYRAVHALVAGVAASTPLVLAVEDLHWADLPSLRLFEYVAHRAAAGGLLLVATLRDADPAVSGPLAAIVGGLAGHPSTLRMALGGLSAGECGVFITETVGVAPSAEVAATVHAHTGGNPFFVVELARLLSIEGALGRDEGRTLRVPAGVRDVISRRLRRLPAPTRDLLDLAAVLGREVDPALVAVAARIDEDEAAPRLDAAVAAGLLVPAPGSAAGQRFSHALVQQTIQSEMAPPARARAHARAAVALRVIHGDDADHAGERAHHLIEGVPVVDPEEACAAALAAAEVAQRRLAYERAGEFLRRALEVTARMPPGRARTHRELDVHHGLARLLSVTEGYQSDAVAAEWHAARELSLRLGDTPEVLDSVWGLARLTRTRAEFTTSVMFGRELLDLAGACPSASPLFAIAGREALGMVALFTGEVGTAVRHLGEMVERADAAIAADRALVLEPSVAGRCYLACARWLVGDAAGAAAMMAEARTVAGAGGHRLTQAVAGLYSAKLATMQAAAEEAVLWTDEVYHLTARGPIGPLEEVAGVLAAWGRARLGDHDGQEARLARAISALGASGWRLAMTYFLWLQADAHLAAGRLERAIATAERGLAEAEATGERYYEAELCRLIGQAVLDAGPRPDREAARAWFGRARATAQQQGSVPFRRRAEEALAAVRVPAARTPGGGRR